MRRALTMGALVLAGEAIYTLPYGVRRDYASVITDVTSMTNAELGHLNSLFGVFALLCYFPGGWLADRVSIRTLLSTSLASTGLGGLAYATLPGYQVMLGIFAFWGVTTILTFWGALVKAARQWGREDRQGRAFGILDGGRGLVAAVLSTVALLVFQAAATPATGLRLVILTYAVLALFAATVCWFVLPKDEAAAPGSESNPEQTAPRTQPRSGEPQLRRVLRMPSVWLNAVVVLAAYAGYWGTFDLAQYAHEGHGWDEVKSASLSIFGLWLRPLACVAAGWLADEVGVGRVIAAALLLLAGGFTSLALLPTSLGAGWLLWIHAAVICSSVFALRGTFYALLQEGGVPLYLTGTAVGLISCVGYTPDVFAPAVIGHLTDSHPGALGHRHFFLLLAAFALVGVVAVWLGGALKRRVCGCGRLVG